LNLSRRKLHQTACGVLAGGNIAFGLVAIAAPTRVTKMTGETEDGVRVIALRDLQAGLALLTARRKHWPLLGGVRSDLWEAAGWLRSRPRLAAVPLLWAGLGLVALVTRD
jgi:hypothetical protein